VETKVLLIGYPKSKQILSFSSYLTDKYFKSGADVVYLNYGRVPVLFGGHSYQRLKRISFKTSNAWSRQLHLSITKLVHGDLFILGLDDYLLSKRVNEFAYRKLMSHILENKECVGAKLGLWTSYDLNTTDPIDDGLYRVAQGAPWPITTQFTIWKKDFILDYLKKIDTPWEFELKGSNYLNKQSQYIIGSYDPALSYPEPSALSMRHPKRVSVFANQDRDIDFGVENGLIKKSSLILGQWNGHSPAYRRGTDSHWLALRHCSPKEYEYNYNILMQCVGPQRKKLG
jgi:hypothetical protein